MKKLSLVVALLFALSFPAVTSAKAGGGHKAAAKHCKTLRAEIGAAAFRESFAGKNGKRAMKRCVAAQIKARKAAKRRAKKACKADVKRCRALKRCVRDRLAAAPAASPESFKEAVEQCQAAQADDPEGFADEYGDGSDALANCVEEQSAADEDAEDSETGADE
jgi:hypothetical protein